jgi:hypothetical protein
MKRRTEITIETERVVVMSKKIKQETQRLWCGCCAEGVDMVTTDHAAIAAHVTSRTIFHWAESGRVHSMETPEGLLLICSNSLP